MSETLKNYLQSDPLYRACQMIANEPNELSFEKIYWQRNNFKKIAQIALEEFYKQKENNN